MFTSFRRYAVARLSYTIPDETGAGARTITASFAGDLDYKPASRDLILTAGKASSVLYVNSAAGSIGQTVTLVASLWSGSSRLASRTLNYSYNGTPIGAAMTDSNGTARLAYTVSADGGAGSRRITVSFAGDAAYSPGQQDLSLTTSKASTVIYTNAARGTAGRAVNLVASLWTNGARLTGKSLTYAEGATVLGTAVTDSSGVARFPYSIPANASSGDHTITVSFMGDSAYSLSNHPLVLTIN